MNDYYRAPVEREPTPKVGLLVRLWRWLFGGARWLEHFDEAVPQLPPPADVLRTQCASPTNPYNRCPGLADPRCAADNCTSHCNEHCNGRCGGKQGT